MREEKRAPAASTRDAKARGTGDFSHRFVCTRSVPQLGGLDLDTGRRHGLLTGLVYPMLTGRSTRRSEQGMGTHGHSSGDSGVMDRVGKTMVPIQPLLLQSGLESFSNTRGLLLSIADHRTIDRLRPNAPSAGFHREGSPTRAA